MKRLLSLLVPLAVVVTGCSLNVPKPATYVTDSSATLNAAVSSNEGGEVRYWFRYGTTTDYGTETPDRTVAFPAGHDASGPTIPVSEPISGLEPNTTYHFQGCASPGIAAGSRACLEQDRTFTTGPAGGRSGIAFSSEADVNPGLHVVNADGSDDTPLTESSVIAPAWSPDAKRLLFADTDTDAGVTNSNIHVIEADGANRTRLTATPEFDEIDPAWSPDGGRIAFACFCSTGQQVWVMDADGSNRTRLGTGVQPAWSPDGSRIAFADLGAGGGIFVVDAGGGTPVRLTGGSFDFSPAWSPDGRRIAFNSDREGTRAIWVMDADGDNQARLTEPSGDGDQNPTWAPDGARLAFISALDGAVPIYLIDADGTGKAPLAVASERNTDVAWSPRP